MAQGDGMPRLELIFLHSANGGGCFRRRQRQYPCSPNMTRASKYVGLKRNVVEVVILSGRWTSIASRMSPTTYCGLNARDAFASSKFKRRMRSGSMGRTLSRKMLGSDCSTRPAQIEPVVTRRMDAGPTGVTE